MPTSARRIPELPSSVVRGDVGIAPYKAATDRIPQGGSFHFLKKFFQNPLDIFVLVNIIQ